MAATDKALKTTLGNMPIPQVFDEAANDWAATKGTGGVPDVRVTNFPSSQSVSFGGRTVTVAIETTATTTDQQSAFDVELITTIANDGTSNILFNLDADTASPGTFTLKPGERLNDFPRKCLTLHYKATIGTQAFRAWGVK